ncbi:MAG: hypothetical protein WCI92_06405 [Bacteroidota bacterium]
MLRWISKSGTFIQFAIYAILLLGLWIPAFIHPVLPVITPADGPLYSLLASFLLQFPALSVAIALILVVTQSVVLFYLFQSNGFFGRSNFLPAIIVLLAYSWNGSFQTMHALLPAGIFIIIALNSILTMYGRQAAYHQVFGAAFSLSIASLFYIPLTYFLLLLWFTLITYRVSSWREYAISIIGYILPFIYYISWLYWDDKLIMGLNQISGSIFRFSLPEPLSKVNLIWLIVSASIILIAMVAVLNIMGDKLISLRRRAWVLFNFSFIGLIVVLLTGWPMLSINYLFVIPASFFITGSLTLIKRPFWFEVLAIGYFLLFIGVRMFMVLQ